MSYLEDAVDDALFAEHLVPADENDANTIGMMKSALAITAGKDRGVFCWGSGSGVWVDGSGVRAMCWAVGPGDVLGGWGWCPGDVLGGWAGSLLDVRGSNFCILDPSVPIYFQNQTHRIIKS